MYILTFQDIVTNIQEPIFARVSISDNFLYIVTERGSLFIADLMLHIFRHFRFHSCSFVVPVISISPGTVGIVSSSGLFVVFNESSRTAHGFRLGAGQVFSPAIVSHFGSFIAVGCRGDWLRCFIMQPSFWEVHF